VGLSRNTVVYHQITYSARQKRTATPQIPVAGGGIHFVPSLHPFRSLFFFANHIVKTNTSPLSQRRAFDTYLCALTSSSAIVSRAVATYTL
jgi:hypothetical protein